MRLLPHLLLSFALLLWGCESEPSTAPAEGSSLDASAVASQNPLFLSFWSGMSPEEFRDVARHHTPDTTFNLTTPPDQSWVSP